MSRTRNGLRPEDWHDDGASVGRITFARYGVKGGTIYGAMAVGDSQAEKNRISTREHKARAQALKP